MKKQCNLVGENPLKNISIYCYQNVSDIINAVNSVAHSSDIIEMGAHHAGAHVLLVADVLRPELQRHAKDSLYIENVNPDVLKAYFKQKPIRIEKNLICVETKKLTQLFEIAQQILTTSDFLCLEINRSSGIENFANALFCNGSDTSIFKSFKCVNINIIESPSETLKSFY